MERLKMGAAILAIAASTGAAAQWSTCAREGEFCRFEGSRVVEFGAGNRWVEKRFTDGVKCVSARFGDPAPGVVKSCRVRMPAAQGPSVEVTSEWVRCAREGQVCKFRGEHRIAFGADRRFKYRVFRDGVRCVNENFGDPAPGVVKSCYYKPG